MVYSKKEKRSFSRRSLLKIATLTSAGVLLPGFSLEDILESDLVRELFSERNHTFIHHDIEDSPDINTNIITVMYYNTAGLRGRDFDEKRDIWIIDKGPIPKKKIDGIQNLLKEKNPPISAWTEIDRGSRYSGGVDMVEELAKPDENYVYANNFGRDYRWNGPVVDMGNALISCFRFYNPEQQSIVNEQDPSTDAARINKENERRYGSKKMLHSYFIYNKDSIKQKIGFAAVHLDDSNAEQNNIEFRLLMERVIKSQTPYIIAGDFNRPPYLAKRRKFEFMDYTDFDGFEWLASYAKDNLSGSVLFSSQGDNEDLYTYPSSNPQVALDHAVIVNPNKALIKLMFKRTYIIKVPHSDHFPVFSEIEFVRH